MCAWAVDNFPPLDMVLLPTVLQYNKPDKSKNHPSAFVCYLVFAKWNFVFTLRNSGPAKSDQPDRFLCPCSTKTLTVFLSIIKALCSRIYLDIFLWLRRYHDISLATGLFAKLLVNSFDLRCESDTLHYKIQLWDLYALA